MFLSFMGTATLSQVLGREMIARLCVVSLLLVALSPSHPAALTSDDLSRRRSSPVVLCTSRPRKSNKPHRLHDFERDQPDGDEYSTDLESDSQTVLVYPKASNESSSENATAAEPEPPKSKMVGTGRKL